MGGCGGPKATLYQSIVNSVKKVSRIGHYFPYEIKTNISNFFHKKNVKINDQLLLLGTLIPISLEFISFKKSIQFLLLQVMRFGT